MSVKFENNTIKFKDQLKNKLIAFLYEVGGEMTSRVRRNTKSDTGQLKNSWKYVVEPDDMKVTIGNPLENAIWEEFGTGDFAKDGKGRKGAWYVPVEMVLGKKKPTYDGKVVVVYGKGGKAYFKTNGKKPKRTLHNTFKDNEAKIERILQRKLKELGDD